MYIFLDFDGVLNSGRYLSAHPEQLRRHKSCRLVFDPAAMELLNTLMLRHPAEIVISSDWRKAANFDVLAERMTRDGFGYRKRIVSQTPDYGRAPRGTEIHAWLMARNVRGKPFVVLDDRTDMDAVDSHLINTDPVHGLTKADVNRASIVLSQGKKVRASR